MSWTVFYPYFGGKGRIAVETQDKFFPDHLNRVYVFGGSGGDIINQAPPLGWEVFNDLNANIYAAFWCLMNRYEDFIKWTEWRVHSRQHHAECKLIVNSPCPDWRTLYRDQWEEHLWNRGKAWYYCCVHSFRARQDFTMLRPVNDARSGIGNQNRWRPESEKTRLEKVFKRLVKITLEKQDFEKLIERMDGPDVLFICDPPYWKEGGAYFQTFRTDDHLRLANILQGVKGKFLVHYDDQPEIRELYKNFRIETLDIEYSTNTRREENKKDQELVIMNYPSEDRWKPAIENSLLSYIPDKAKEVIRKEDEQTIV